MKNGLKIIDMDTHVNPNYDTLIKYVDPGFRQRLPELKPYLRTQDMLGQLTTVTVAPYPYERFPGEAPSSGEVEIRAGGKGALESRVTSRSSHLKEKPAPEVQDENAAGRLQDMEREGRDMDFLIPGTWASAITGIKDPSLITGLYHAYHNYIGQYCSQAPDRLKSMVLVPGADIDWAVREVKRLVNEPWVTAVWPILPQGFPIDHPALDPLWRVMNDAHLPIFFHSFFYEPPYFPGYRDIWDNVVVARTAAHPWAASRFLSYLIVGQIFDRYPNINAAACEVGHGWLPHWLIRLGEMSSYISGATPKLKHAPIDYVKMGRFRCGIEVFEGPEITKFCIDTLGVDALLYQSDYPHGESNFPETPSIVRNWSIWKDLPAQALPNLMAGNAERFLRLL